MYVIIYKGLIIKFGKNCVYVYDFIMNWIIWKVCLVSFLKCLI